MMLVFIPKTLVHFPNCILVSSYLSFSIHIMEYLWELTHLCLRLCLDAIFFGWAFLWNPDFWFGAYFFYPPADHPQTPCLKLYAFLPQGLCLLAYFSLHSVSSAPHPSRL